MWYVRVAQEKFIERGEDMQSRLLQIVCMGSNIESVLRRALIQVRVFLTTFIQMFGVQYQFLLIAVLNISSVSLMTTLERYGFIL